MVISDEYLKGKKVTCSTWNHDKKLSDHIGVVIDFHSLFTPAVLNQ